MKSSIRRAFQYLTTSAGISLADKRLAQWNRQEICLPDFSALGQSKCSNFYFIIIVLMSTNKKNEKKNRNSKMFTCLEHCVPVVIAMQIESDNSVPALVYTLKKWAGNGT